MNGLLISGWMLRTTLCCLLSLCPLLASATTQSWEFQVLLDGKPIGTHRFDINETAAQRTVISEANFAVTLLGLTVYRYQHTAQEQWQGECLRALQSSTLDGGDSFRVDLSATTLPDCIMSYAYWNPLLLRQQRLVNAQTGKIDSVTITALGAASIEVRGDKVTAQRWRISGLPAPIDVWYATNSTSGPGIWLGLDAYPDGKQLSYRLR